MLKEVKGRQGILALLGVDEQDWLDWTGLGLDEPGILSWRSGRVIWLVTESLSLIDEGGAYDLKCMFIST